MKNITKLLLVTAACGLGALGYMLATRHLQTPLTAAIVCTIVFLVAFPSVLFVKDKKTWEDVVAVVLALICMPMGILSWSFHIQGLSFFA
ncbi:hypothetical protein MKQ70_26710 [Chitinophaga sedimenti]|uniref:hypothetical protein n=1 Tax=Chitinophaga sedimenti TaxID=2033606 RepID=UPI0020047A51|nr:hypothetical protein [Chitinophaga sedimenti]MCK7558394.1 hypothetical protein [Chitinophaga sedimenti]